MVRFDHSKPSLLEAVGLTEQDLRDFNFDIRRDKDIVTLATMVMGIIMSQKDEFVTAIGFGMFITILGLGKESKPSVYVEILYNAMKRDPEIIDNLMLIILREMNKGIDFGKMRNDPTLN